MPKGFFFFLVTWGGKKPLGFEWVPSRGEGEGHNYCGNPALVMPKVF